MIVVTGASGQLGRLVIEKLLETVPPNDIVAAVRDPVRVSDLAARGVQVRKADYDQPGTLVSAFEGADRLLLISSSEVGRRTSQHQAIIDAAKAAGVKLIAYTSILRADSSPLPLAKEHQETEALLLASGVPFVLLRNGWYTENYLAGVPVALEHGIVLGSAGNGRIASAARADYAQAAVAVLTTDDQAGRVYELAGDESYSLDQLAAEIARQSGREVNYQNLPEADFKAALLEAGLPDGLATVLSESDIGASQNGLFDDGHQLSQLIGRQSTSLTSMVKAALA
jgi:NAD(P)H dehydrogenase (quinone)